MPDSMMFIWPLSYRLVHCIDRNDMMGRTKIMYSKNRQLPAGSLDLPHGTKKENFR